MEAYAVVATGGKQYRVQANDVIKVETVEAEAGSKVELDQVLALSDGSALKVGTPTIGGAKVSATVVEQIRGPKVVAFKKKRRKGSRVKKGHRQPLTVLKIDAIG